MTYEQNHGRLLVFVRDRGPDDDSPVGPHGPILAAAGSLSEEVEEGGLDIDDYIIDRPGCTGLLVFEGRLEYSGGDDPDVYLRGTWRRVTLGELDLVSAGANPFETKVRP